MSVQTLPNLTDPAMLSGESAATALEPIEEAVADEFLVVRTFFASRRLLFEAWTDPRQMAKWWGPEGFTNIGCELDARRGGACRLVIGSPEGVEYPLVGEYREVAEPERLVMTMDTSGHPEDWQDLVNRNGGTGAADAAGKMVQMVTFEELDGRTRLAVRIRFEAPEIREAMLKAGLAEGWSRSLDRLARCCAEGREIVSTRVIDAPRGQVFRAFSDPGHLAKWWGPAGFTNTFREFDFRVGGHWRFVMHGPDGVDYENHSIFDEIVAPERIVFRHLDPRHHFQMTILLADEGGKTALTWRMQHDSVAKSEAVQEFVTIANEQNFDRLEAQLARM